MLKHELPEYIPVSVGIGKQYKVSIQNVPKEFTRLYEKERAGSDGLAEKADRWFLAALIALYGRANFKRGNLDAGRLNRLFRREIVAISVNDFDLASGEAELRIEYESALTYLNSMQ